MQLFHHVMLYVLPRPVESDSFVIILHIMLHNGLNRCSSPIDALVYHAHVLTQSSVQVSPITPASQANPVLKSFKVTDQALISLSHTSLVPSHQALIA